MKSRNGKPTEDPLCSKKEKHRWFSLYLSFLLQISREFHFSLYSFFLSVAIRFVHEYIYIYINLCHSLSLRYGARCVRRAWAYLKVELINKTTFLWLWVSRLRDIRQILELWVTESYVSVIRSTLTHTHTHTHTHIYIYIYIYNKPWL